MATTYNDKIYGQKVLQQLNSLLLPIRAFTTDISDELKGPGDAVVVPLYGNTTTTTFTQSTTVMEQTGGTLSAITVTLDSDAGGDITDEIKTAGSCGCATAPSGAAAGLLGALGAMLLGRRRRTA